MLDIDEVIASAKLPEKTVALVLRGDLQAEWENLERQLNAEEAADDSSSLAGNPRAQELSEQMRALEQQMRDHQTVFRFRGLSAKQYSDLLAKHKAPDGKDDEDGDIDWETYPAALIAACCVGPVMTVEQAKRLNNAITSQQWDSLFAVAVACNQTKVDVPFSLAASAIRAGTGSNSKQPARGASPDLGSLAESLAG